MNPILFTSTTKQDLVVELYNCRKLKQASVNILKNKSTQLFEDLLSELYLHVLEMPEVKFHNLINNQLIYFYSIKFMTVSAKATSTFSLKHKPKEQLLDFIPEHSESNDLSCLEMIQQTNIKHEIEQYLNSLHWYDQMIFRMYVHDFTSTRKLAKATKIPASALHLTIHEVKQKVNDFIFTKQLLND